MLDVVAAEARSNPNQPPLFASSIVGNLFSMLPLYRPLGPAFSLYRKSEKYRFLFSILDQFDNDSWIRNFQNSIRTSLVFDKSLDDPKIGHGPTLEGWCLYLISTNSVPLGQATGTSTTCPSGTSILEQVVFVPVGQADWLYQSCAGTLPYQGTIQKGTLRYKVP